MQSFVIGHLRLLFALAVFSIIPLAAFHADSSNQKIDTRKCPTVEIKGPRKSKALKQISYRARVKNFSEATGPVFKWAVVGGYVVNGQGSEVITVKPYNEVIATVAVENVPVGCDSNSYTIITKITDVPYFHPPPIVREIIMSPPVIYRHCPTGTKSDTCAATGDEIKLTADAAAPIDGLPFLYVWSVKAGRLKGEGRIVKWDLSGVGVGTYTVTVTVVYFAHAGSGSATVTITDCMNCKSE